LANYDRFQLIFLGLKISSKDGVEPAFLDKAAVPLCLKNAGMSNFWVKIKYCLILRGFNLN